MVHCKSRINYYLCSWVRGDLSGSPLFISNSSPVLLSGILHPPHPLVRTNDSCLSSRCKSNCQNAHNPDMHIPLYSDHTLQPLRSRLHTRTARRPDGSNVFHLWGSWLPYLSSFTTSSIPTIPRRRRRLMKFFMFNACS